MNSNIENEFTPCERLAGWKTTICKEYKVQFCEGCKIRDRCEDRVDKETRKCYLDGDALCIVGSDFSDLAVSDAMFIPLTEEQITEFKKL